MTTVNHTSKHITWPPLIVPVWVKAVIIALMHVGYGETAYALDESNPYPGTINVYDACPGHVLTLWPNQDKNRMCATRCRTSGVLHGLNIH
jgi:hypothetical protein